MFKLWVIGKVWSCFLFGFYVSLMDYELLVEMWGWGNWNLERLSDLFMFI